MSTQMQMLKLHFGNGKRLCPPTGRLPVSANHPPTADLFGFSIFHFEILELRSLFIYLFF
jgi:hypothetical protein